MGGVGIHDLPKSNSFASAEDCAEHCRIEAALLRHVTEAAPGHRIDVLTAPPNVAGLKATSPKTARIAVVLPEPFGPRKPTT
jgi:2-oxo-4-hydroxy-4-carboxy--5-ureidoimidazoline (OHCU) decarboxylase